MQNTMYIHNIPNYQQWRHGGGDCDHKFWSVGKLYSGQKIFFGKNAKYVAENPPFSGNLGAELKF